MELTELQAKGITVSLYPWEDSLARQIGMARDHQNRGKGNRVSYDETRLMSDNALANVHSVAAEIGTCRVLGAYCMNAVWKAHEHAEYSELPDGLWDATELEIKWRRSAKSMPVDLKDAEANRLVLWAEVRLAGCHCPTCGEMARRKTQVRVLGGGYALKLWGMGSTYNGDGNRRSVPAFRLTPIARILYR